MTAIKHGLTDDTNYNAAMGFDVSSQPLYVGFGLPIGGIPMTSGPTAFDAPPAGVTVSGYADYTALNNFVAANDGTVNGFSDAGAYGSTFNGSASSGFIFSNGTATAIDDPDAGSVGTTVQGVSDDGKYITGYYNNAGNNDPLYYLYHNGVFTSLAGSIPMSSNTEVVGVNASGDVAGNDDNSGFVESGGAYTTISYPGSTSTHVTGINDAGEVAGYYDVTGDNYKGSQVTHSFVESGGIYTEIDDPDAGPGTMASGITSDGQVFGNYEDGSFVMHGFIENGGVYTTVDDPNGGGGAATQGVEGINSDGVILGIYQDANGNFTQYTAQETLCYVRGTHILTPVGEVAVEDLHIGDRVVTRFGGIQTVKWVGRQSYDTRFLHQNAAKLPVRVRAGALGEGLPARDLFVSPGHSLLVDGTLLLARTLINGVTITQECPLSADMQVDYFHPELAVHDCIIAEGTWSETFADGPGLRSAYHNEAEFYTMYPDHRTPDDIRLCAPRPQSGASLEAALRPVVARASADLASGHLWGFVDRVSGREIDGWAWDESRPDMPVLLQICLADEVIHTALASDFRADLKQAGFGGGRCAFFLTLPVDLPRHLLSIRRAADGMVLPMTEGCLASGLLRAA